MSAPQIRGAQPPPVSSEPEYDVVGLPREGWLEALLLGDLVWGIDCHWVSDAKTPTQGRTEQCTAYAGTCPHCGVHRKIWLGFAPVINLARKARQVLRMGPETYRAIGKFAGRLTTWHGVGIRLAKCHSNRTAGCVVEAYDRALPTPIPHPHSMARSIKRVLRTEQLPDFHLDADESLDVPLSDVNGGA